MSCVFLSQTDIDSNGGARRNDLRARIEHITEGDYATAKRDVDKLRAELGQPPLPSLQATLDEKSAQ